MIEWRLINESFNGDIWFNRVHSIEQSSFIESTVFPKYEWISTLSPSLKWEYKGLNEGPEYWWSKSINPSMRVNPQIMRVNNSIMRENEIKERLDQPLWIGRSLYSNRFVSVSRSIHGDRCSHRISELEWSDKSIRPLLMVGVGVLLLIVFGQ